jgi:CubicO group peptidase (beta-lactamase class C family)
VTAWLRAALDHLPRWLEHQMRVTEQPGCAVAVAYRGELVFEAAFGHADWLNWPAAAPASCATVSMQSSGRCVARFSMRWRCARI